MKEETNRKHYSVEEYKKITNFEKTKKVLNKIKLELPTVPDITDIGKFTLKRDEKIIEEIIKPKDNLINNLYNDNLILQQELSRQAKIVEKAEKYEKERKSIINDNSKLHNEVEQIKNDYMQKEFYLKLDYDNKIKHLKKENSHLNRIIDKFYKTIDKFIEWICHKFNFGDFKELVKKFENETCTFIDPVKQMKKEEREKEFELER